MGNNYQRDDTNGGEFHKKELFKATCAECAKSCEIPFRPSGDRPVYCKDCFAKKGGATQSASPRRDFHADRAVTPAPERNRDIVELKIQVAELGRKIDHLIDSLTKPKAAEVREAVKTAVEAKIELAETLNNALGKEPASAKGSGVAKPAKKAKKA